MEFLPGSIAGPKLHFPGESASSDVHVNTRMTLFLIFQGDREGCCARHFEAGILLFISCSSSAKKKKGIVVLQPNNVICVLVTTK